MADNFTHVLTVWQASPLTDVLCSGVATNDILSPFGGQLAQVDAITAAAERVANLSAAIKSDHISTLLSHSYREKIAIAGKAARCSAVRREQQ